MTGEPQGALSRPHPAQTRPGQALALMEGGPTWSTVCLAERPADQSAIGGLAEPLCITPISLIVDEALRAKRHLSEAGPAPNARTMPLKLGRSSSP